MLIKYIIIKIFYYQTIIKKLDGPIIKKNKYKKKSLSDHLNFL